MHWEILHESVKIHQGVYDSSTNQVRINGNSWQSLTIHEIFSLKLGIKCRIPLLGHYFQNKCLSESCCCIGSTFGVTIPTVDSAKKTASKKGEVTQTFLLFGCKKLIVKVYHHHHQPVDHQSLTILINLPILFHS